MAESTARERAELHLDGVDSTIDGQCKRLRALAKSILALVPAQPFHHPLLSVNSIEVSDPEFEQRVKLRDGLVAVRNLAEMIDDVACTMDDSASYEMEEARKELGLRPPAYSITRRSKEADHA
jgi:hypothetical protein